MYYVHMYMYMYLVLCTMYKYGVVQGSTIPCTMYTYLYVHSTTWYNIQVVLELWNSSYKYTVRVHSTMYKVHSSTTLYK